MRIDSMDLLSMIMGKVETATQDHPEGLNDSVPLTPAMREISITIRVRGRGIDAEGDPSIIIGYANFADPHAPELTQYLESIRALYGPPDPAPEATEAAPEDEDEDQDDDDFADPDPDWEYDDSDDEDEDGDEDETDEPYPSISPRESYDPARFE